MNGIKDLDGLYSIVSSVGYWFSELIVERKTPRIIFHFFFKGNYGTVINMFCLLYTWYYL